MKKLNIFNKLVSENSEQYFRTVFRIVKSKEDAQEVVQEGFAKAFARINPWEGEDTLGQRKTICKSVL
jgi:DNA-directed RNA polymerase specialized sigma24 family protein